MYYYGEKKEYGRWCFFQYGTNKNGLTKDEVKRRIEQNGKNVFPTGKQKSVFLILLSQFKSAIMIILFVAIALSLIIGEYANVIFISTVILINTIIWFIQEYNAERSASRLKTHIRVKVLREGQTETIDSEELVVGDIVYLEYDESILTEESDAVVKNANAKLENMEFAYKANMAYAGTVVTTGRACGVVTTVANNTEYGKIAKKIVEIKDNPSPLTVRINKFTKQISVVFLIVAIVISGILFFKGYSWYNIFSQLLHLSFRLFRKD